MLYTIFIKKNEKDKFNYLVKLIQSYYSKNSDSFILGWPGYIGVNTSSLDSFFDIFGKINKSPQGYFFHPLNEKLINNISNIDYLNNKFGNYHLNQIKLKDHSKILTFLKFKQSCDKTRIQNSLKMKNYTIDCLIVGSSNQSYNTYCHIPTLKGEMDVCMIDFKNDDELSHFLDFIDIHKNNIIVSKEITNITKTDLTEIVDIILKKTLK